MCICVYNKNSEIHQNLRTIPKLKVLKGEQLLCKVTAPLYLKTQIKVFNMITQATSFKPATFTQERPLITIEFASNIHPSETEYSYKHPQFVFGDRVTLKNEYPKTEYTVCALELIESKTASGRLLNQPRWKYKITNGEVFFEKEETALSAPSQTCADCINFQNYNEPKFFEVDGEKIANRNLGKGWCRLHNRPARTHHLKTNDCVVSTQTVSSST